VANHASLQRYAVPTTKRSSIHVYVDPLLLEKRHTALANHMLIFESHMCTRREESHTEERGLRWRRSLEVQIPNPRNAVADRFCQTYQDPVPSRASVIGTCRDLANASHVAELCTSKATCRPRIYRQSLQQSVVFILHFAISQPKYQFEKTGPVLPELRIHDMTHPWIPDGYPPIGYR
jgi:hypothetical protein